jgi:Na+-transporting methylmalonyl-CoA/oxaloacetate decarboxylase gamma subunit
MNSFLEWSQRGWGQVVEHGLWTTLGGMLVVFAALSLIAMFIAILPRVLNAIAPLPEEDEHAAAPIRKTPAAEDDEVAVAIAFAMHTELQRTRR